MIAHSHTCDASLNAHANFLNLPSPVMQQRPAKAATLPSIELAKCVKIPSARQERRRFAIRYERQEAVRDEV